MKRANVIRAADLFCGAGGTTAGLYRAADELGLNVDLLAVNHWDIAIATHSANHREAQHLCETLDGVNPRKVVPGGRLDLLVASPECIHHSRARGGKPMNDQSRASAWHVLRWAEALDISNILLENVREFAEWGPLGSNGKPLKSRRGETFQAFIAALRSLGYNVEYKVLNAADYGDPTTRERLFVMARKGRRKIVWPTPTHSRAGERTLFGQTKKWRAAREIIDWSIEGRSIFGRKKPLSPNTMRRIMAGLRKYCGLSFIMGTGGRAGQMEPRSTAEPLRTILPNNRLNVIEPFICSAGGPKVAARSVSEPMNTVLARDHMALVEPFLVNMKGKSNVRRIDQPTPTITAGVRHLAVAEPFLVMLYGTNNARSLDLPAPTVTATGNHIAVAEPFVMHTTHRGNRRVHSTDAPLPTVTGANRGEMALVEPFVIGQQSGSVARSTKKPLMTVAGKGAIGLVEPYLVRYNGTGGAEPVSQPMPTLTAKDRFALVEPKHGRGKGALLLDIRFRMLQPHELAAAMSFDKGYTFTGNRGQQVRQIGNAVPVELARSLCLAIIADEQGARKRMPGRKQEASKKGLARAAGG